MPTILWAEDNQGDQSLIQATLLALQCKAQVRFVEDGIEFLASCAKAPPSLGVLDIKMPRMSGIEALSQLRASVARPPLVVFSSTTQTAEINECRRLGALDVIHKPMDFGSFQKAVGQVVSHLPSHAARLSPMSVGAKVDR